MCNIYILLSNRTYYYNYKPRKADKKQLLNLSRLTLRETFSDKRHSQSKSRWQNKNIQSSSLQLIKKNVFLFFKTIKIPNFTSKPCSHSDYVTVCTYLYLISVFKFIMHYITFVQSAHILYPLQFPLSLLLSKRIFCYVL